MSDDLKPRDYVVPRGGRWYFRRRIPQDLLPQYRPKLEFLESLGTADLAEANRRATLRTLELDQEFARQRAVRGGPFVEELADDEVERIAKLFGADTLSVDDFFRLTGFGVGGVESYREGVEELLPGWREAFSEGDIEPVREMTRKELARHGLKMREDSGAFRAVALAILGEVIRAYEIVAERLDGNPIPTPAVQPLVVRGGPAVASGDSLANLLDYWKLQKVRRPRTVDEAELAVREFERINGVSPAAAYVKSHAVAFRDALLREGKLQPASINKRMNLLGGVFSNAARNDKIPANPFANVPRPSEGRRKSPKSPYSLEDLTAIFSSPVFIDSSYRPIGGAGEAAFWLPLLALWTGARLEELGQLLTSDVRERGGIHFLHLAEGAEGEKTLKNASSERLIPLHPELLRCGFLEYVGGVRKDESPRLFPLVTSEGARQWTAPFSQWWGKYARKKVGINDTTKSFHSFRHNFKDACRENGIAPDVSKKLMGHAEDDGVAEGYGHGHSLSTLARAIERVRYEGLDLSHLLWSRP